MARKRVKFKQAKAVEHICDKIFINDTFDVIGVKPYGNNNPMKSIYAVAVRKTLRSYLFSLIKWVIALVIAVMIAFFVAEKGYLILSFAFAGGVAIPFIVHVVCCILSFRGNVLKKLPFDYKFPLYVANATKRYCDETQILSPPQRALAPEGKRNKQAKLDADYEKKLTKISRENAESYKKLDRLSQVLDTDIIRIKKMNLLLSLDSKLSYGWEYESDSVLTKSNDLNRQYIYRVSKIDKNCLGPVSTGIYMNGGK